MKCTHYQLGLCRSCQWLDKPYSQQVIDKQDRLNELLQPFTIKKSLKPVTGKTLEFRNKAKMVVTGSVEKPILGIINADGVGVDLCDCPLYGGGLRHAFAIIKRFIAKAGLVPYSIERRRGELKFILLTQNEAGQLMLRFVLRSENKLAQLKNSLAWLLKELPTLSVVSVNLQPVPMAILEGEKEIILTEQHLLEQTLNHIPLFIYPGSFFQTNSHIAAELYDTAKRWLKPLAIRHIWDLFCGVGGFGLHCANNNIKLTGIEIHPQAIDCARRSAQLLGLTDVHFQAMDSTKFAIDANLKPDIVIVNPPRRGIGSALCNYFKRLETPYILYSSCNAESMVRDLADLDNYCIVQIQLFDMFPHTPHYEVLALLSKR